MTRRPAASGTPNPSSSTSAPARRRASRDASSRLSRRLRPSPASRLLPDIALTLGRRGPRRADRGAPTEGRPRISAYQRPPRRPPPPDRATDAPDLATDARDRPTSASPRRPPPDRATDAPDRPTRAFPRRPHPPDRATDASDRPGQRIPSTSSLSRPRNQRAGTTVARVRSRYRRSRTAVGPASTAVASVGTSLDLLCKTVARLSTSVARHPTSSGRLGSPVAPLGTSVGRVGTTVARLGNAVARLRWCGDAAAVSGRRASDGMKWLCDDNCHWPPRSSLGDFRQCRVSAERRRPDSMSAGNNRLAVRCRGKVAPGARS